MNENETSVILWTLWFYFSQTFTIKLSGNFKIHFKANLLPAGPR